MHEFETTTADQSIAEHTNYSMSEQKVVLPYSEEGQKLFQLLKKAAGLEGQRIESITCTMGCGEIVKFSAVFQAKPQDVAAAFKDDGE